MQRAECLMPGGDLVLPAQQRPAERAGVDWLVGDLEIIADPFAHPLGGEVGIGIELAHGLLGLPQGSHVASGIAGTQSPAELLFALFVRPLLGPGEQAAPPVERIVLAPPVSEGLPFWTRRRHPPGDGYQAMRSQSPAGVK